MYFPVILVVFFTLALAQTGTGTRFSAYLSSHQTLSANEIVKFNTINTNVNNAYSVTTGKFTAPVAGYYFFSVNFRCFEGETLFLRLVRNGSIKARGFARSGSGSMSAVLLLAANQQVWVQRNVGGGTQKIYELYGSFSGFRI